MLAFNTFGRREKVYQGFPFVYPSFMLSLILCTLTYINVSQDPDRILFLDSFPRPVDEKNVTV